MNYVPIRPTGFRKPKRPRMPSWLSSLLEGVLILFFFVVAVAAFFFVVDVVYKWFGHEGTLVEIIKKNVRFLLNLKIK